MHPLNQAAPYPFEQWWAAAYAAEVTNELLGRRILGQPLIFFRSRDGTATALAGICPHRSFPLAQGRLDDDCVRCPYHGFTFDAQGRCVSVPSQATPPARSSLRHYPVAERGGFVWVWTGASENADPALLPDLEGMGLDARGWVADVAPMITIAGRYTLLIDNLMDLSHVSFVHERTIPGGAAVAAITPAMRETAASLNVERIGCIPPNPLLATQFPTNEGPVHQHFDAEYFGPHLIRTGGAISDGAGTRLGTQNFVHVMTPAAPHEVHYFVVTTRDFGLDRPELSAINMAMGNSIQPEDRAAIEAIEQMLQALSYAPRELSCRADTGALKVRHRLSEQIRREAAASEHSAPTTPTDS